MDEKKLVIFDLDGTLYDLDDVFPMYYSMETKFIEKYYGKSREEAEKFLNDNGVLPYRTEGAKSATDLFIRSGIPTEIWTEYREKFFDPSCICPEKAADSKSISGISDDFTVILLSSNTFNNIKKILRTINIEPDIFDDIVCSDRNLGMHSFSKLEAMKRISQKYNINCKNIYSVGDRFNTDIVPVLEIGGTGILVKNPKMVDYICTDIKNGTLKTSEKYKVYGDQYE